MERGPSKRRATYKDVLDAPAYKVAEIIRGELRLSPRPGGPATGVASVIMSALNRFQHGIGKPGRWLIAVEPELHLNDEIVVPDLAGWRIERMPLWPEEAFFSIAPDWACEVLSKSTEKDDREDKMPLYASFGIPFAWLVQPLRRIVETYRLERGAWATIGVHTGNVCRRIPPFDAIELDLALIWARLPPPRRASEPGLYEYDGP